MPANPNVASSPIPRPGKGDNLRLVRKLFGDPPAALDEINTTYGPICSLCSGALHVLVINDRV